MTENQRNTYKSVIASGILSLGVSLLVFSMDGSRMNEKDLKQKIENKVDKQEMEKRFDEFKKDYQRDLVRIEGKIDKMDEKTEWIKNYLLTNKSISQ